MRHSSVLLSAQSASNLKKNDQPLLVLTRAATLKTTTPAKARLMRGIATAAILLLTIPPAAEAGPGGGGSGSLGGSNFSGRSFAAPRTGVATARFSANHLAGTRVAGPGRIFGNRVISNAALQSRFGFARFHGRFFGS